jgi:FtsZ-interacting cell division protein ZipA
MSIERILQVLLHRRKSLVLIIAIAILALVLVALFERTRTVSRSDIIRKQEIEREAIKKGAEEHMKRLRGNPSEMAKKAFGGKRESESHDKDKKTKSPEKETRKDEKK